MWTLECCIRFLGICSVKVFKSLHLIGKVQASSQLPPSKAMSATCQEWQLSKVCQAVGLGNGSFTSPRNTLGTLCQPAVTLALGVTGQAAWRGWLGRFCCVFMTKRQQVFGVYIHLLRIAPNLPCAWLALCVLCCWDTAPIWLSGHELFPA